MGHHFISYLSASPGRLAKDLICIFLCFAWWCSEPTIQGGICWRFLVLRTPVLKQPNQPQTARPFLIRAHRFQKGLLGSWRNPGKICTLTAGDQMTEPHRWPSQLARSLTERRICQRISDICSGMGHFCQVRRSFLPPQDSCWPRIFMIHEGVWGSGKNGFPGLKFILWKWTCCK